MPTAPYDPLETALQLARVRINDSINGIGGQILTDTASFTPTMVNAGAWRTLQNRLRAIGYTGFARLKDDLIIPAIPPSGSPDPGVNNYITWAGFYNGSGTASSPVLPQEFVAPLLCWERPSGINANFTVIDQCLNGLPTNGAKQSRNLNWEWINDQIRFPGSTITWDLRLRCLAFQPDFPLSMGNLVTSTPIPILDCLDPFSSLIAYEFCSARGDLDAKVFNDSANMAIAAIYSRDTAQPTAARKPSEYGLMRNPYTPGVSVPPAAPQAPVQGNQ